MILLLFLFSVRPSVQISCKDEGNNNVDWYINYKIPKIHHETALGEGTSYTYLTAPGSSSWRLSSKNVSPGSGSMLENTMNTFYSNKQELSYLFYNDEDPRNTTETTVGHLKGVVVFDGRTGFWLVHSIPKFADPDSYNYPHNALIYGQSILCVTFRTAELNEICNQLLYSHPNIYARGITEEVRQQLDDKAKTLFTDNPSFVRRVPLRRITVLKSLGHTAFTSFSKASHYKGDLYSDIIAPELKSSLIVETWRRGSGGILPPSCQSNYTVLDIVSINITITSLWNRKNISFRSMEDHSKWAISNESTQNWICVADMNRMLSQEKRGGGALCFVSSPVVKAFDSVIDDTDHCPVR